MKPIRLTIEGINSFTDAQTLDFEAVGRCNLFCICGKTGAGKTTVFDSIMFALYGKSNKGNLADIVNLSRERAAVELVFEAGGDRYSVERKVKCRAEKNENGEPTGRRLATATDCILYKNGAVDAKGSDDVTCKIRSLIGLDESEFKNVYMLEQGEYAEFLKKQPSKQLEAVGKIFSLMRFGDVHKLANEKQKAAEAERRTVEARIADLGDVSGDGAKEIKSELASLRAKCAAKTREADADKKELEELGKARDAYLAAVQKQRNVAELVVRLGEANEVLKSAVAEETAFLRDNDSSENEAKLKKLREESDRLSALGELDRQCAAAERDFQGKLKELEHAIGCELGVKQSIQKLENAVSEHRNSFGAELSRFLDAANEQEQKSETLSRALVTLGADAPPAAVTSCYYELTGEKNAFDELVKKHADIAAAAEKLSADAADALKVSEKYATEHQAASEALNAANDRLKNAEDSLSAARLASQAAAVAAELNAGDVCPVCGGVFGGHAHVGGDVEKAKQERDKAAQDSEKARSEHDKLKNAVEYSNSEYARISRDAEQKAKEAQELEEQVKNARVDPHSYVKMLDALKAATECADERDKAIAALAGAKPKLAVAKTSREGVEKAKDDAKAKLDDLSARLGDMRGNTFAAINGVKGEIAAVESEIQKYEKQKRGYADRHSAAEAAVKTVEDMLSAARSDCPADAPEFDEEGYKRKKDALEAAKDAIAELNSLIARAEEKGKGLEERLAKYKGLKAEHDERAKLADMYKIISDMTKGKAMLNFVATEYIQNFTASASDILGGLSNGKYSMRYDGEGGFVVSDYLNDGKTRKTDTLSGGELFLASLAVAIAISREVGSGDNAFFFLDEGFGTLDDELIDVVYGALEELAKNCLVGVISHSGSLIERMPICVEVIEATDSAGSKIAY